jgi:hypothetical protein
VICSLYGAVVESTNKWKIMHLVKDIKEWMCSRGASVIFQLFKAFIGYLIVESTASTFDSGESHCLHLISSGREMS